MREAELARAQVFPVSGKGQAIYDKIGTPAVSAARIDETYITVGGHIEEGLYEKIKCGEYVDFGKLVPRDKIIAEEDQRLEMIIRGGGELSMYPFRKGPALTVLQNGSRPSGFMLTYTPRKTHREVLR